MEAAQVSGGRRERKKAATRHAISDVATRLFLDRGFDEVTVKEIADAADVSPTTVFKHFPVKEALVFDEEPERVARLVAAVTDRPQGQGVVDALRDHFLTGRMMREDKDPEFLAFQALVNKTPALRDYARRMILEQESALAEAILTSTSHPISPVVAAGVARFALQAADVARYQPEPRSALLELMELLRSGFRI